MKKQHAREMLTIYKWAEDDLRLRSIEYLEKFDRVQQIGGNYFYIQNQGNTKYRIAIKEGKLTNQCFINEEPCTLEDINRLFENDVKDIKLFFETWDITPIEKYLSSRLGFELKLKKDIQNIQSSWVMGLESEELIDHAGCCKAMLKSLKVITFGDIHFIIDALTGNQALFIPSLNFRYKHLTGGSNGSEIGRVLYDLSKKEFKAYNYDKNEYEAI